MSGCSAPPWLGLCRDRESSFLLNFYIIAILTFMVNVVVWLNSFMLGSIYLYTRAFHSVSQLRSNIWLQFLCKNNRNTDYTKAKSGNINIEKWVRIYNVKRKLVGQHLIRRRHCHLQSVSNMSTLSQFVFFFLLLLSRNMQYDIQTLTRTRPNKSCKRFYLLLNRCLNVF